MRNSRIAPWTFNPFLRILPAFIIGILGEQTFSIPVVIPAFVALVCLAVLISINFSTAFLLSFRRWTGVLMILVIVCAGALVFWISKPTNRDDWYGKKLKQGETMFLRLTEEPVLTSSGFRVTAEFLSAVTGEGMRRLSGNVFVYFRDVKMPPVYGDVITTDEKPREIRGPLNPGGFDFRKYSANNGIHHAVYLKAGNFLLVGSKPNRFVSFLHSCRKDILRIFKKFFPVKEERGIAAALLIGYRADLEKPLLKEYSDAGVVHVIAISGLHLGLIYVVLVWMFSQLKFLRRFVAMRCWLVLTLLWLFSLLTGGSASVLRSAVMFSCMLIGETYFKKSGTWNVMAASAFLLLVYDPLLIYDVGFLLSYAAVAGIVAWQKPLYHSLYIPNRYARHIWNMASVTIVAQLAAFPLCLYYFHQFPNLFLLTNLVVVPLSTIILFGEVLFLLLSSVPEANNILAGTLSFLIRTMNGFVRFSNEIPFSVMHDIYSDGFSTLLLYSCVIAVAAWLLNRDKRFALPSFVILSVFFSYFSFLDIKTRLQNKLVVYHARDGLVIDLIAGNRVWGLAHSGEGGAMSQETFTRPARTLFRVGQEGSVSGFNSVTECNSFRFMNRSIIVLDRQIRFEVSSNRTKVDYLVITGNPSLELQHIFSAVEPGIVIFDATNSIWKIGKWKKQCEQLHLRCFSIPDDGAYVTALHPEALTTHR